MTTLLAAALLACTPAALPGDPGPAGASAAGPSSAESPAGIAREPCGPASASLRFGFRIEVDREVRREHGITVVEFGRAVRRFLCDPEGWLRSGEVRYRYNPDGRYLIGLRTRQNVRERCRRIVGEPVSGNYSCAGSAAREVVINIGPWTRGTDGFPAGLSTYRRMLINHEVGHAMTMRHRSCPRDGARAPVMMQQSMGMNLNGSTCRPNPRPLRSEIRALRAAL